MKKTIFITLLLFSLCFHLKAQFTLVFQDVIANNGNGNSTGFDDRTLLADLVTAGEITAANSTIHANNGRNNLGAIRRWTVEQVFNQYITSCIDLDDAEPEIHIRSYFNPANTTIAFVQPNSIHNPGDVRTQFIPTYLQQHIQSGIDPDLTIPDAIIHFNFNEVRRFNSDFLAANGFGSRIDLYSVALHETTHALGITSLIDDFGNSVLSGVANGPFSTYDQFLVSDPGNNLINSNNFYNVFFNATPGDLTNGLVRYSHPDNLVDFEVYSPSSFNFGTSLSHLDRDRTFFRFQYVLGPGTGYGFIRRTWLQHERRILCNIGYSIRCNGGCSVLRPEGIPDEYTYTRNPREICMDVLAFDISPDNHDLAIDRTFGVGGVGLITQDEGTFRVTSDNKICFIPNQDFCGTVQFHYRPLDVKTGLIGSEGVVTINIECEACPDDPCNLVCNGGFERGIAREFFDQIPAYNELGPKTGPLNTNIPSRVDFWWGQSSDLFVRNSVKVNGVFAVPIPAGPPVIGGNGNTTTSANFNPAVDVTADGGDRFVGTLTKGVNRGGTSERIQTRLVQPLVVGREYNYESFAYVHNLDALDSFPIAGIDVNIGIATDADRTNYESIGIRTITSMDNWQTININGFTPTIAATWLFIDPVDIPTSNFFGYMFHDNVSIRSDQFRVEVEKTVDNPNPLPGETIQFTIRITNTGSQRINSVRVLDDFPTTELEWITNTTSNNSIHETGVLDPNDFEEVTITAKVRPNAPCDIIENCVSIEFIKDNVGVFVENACPRNKACVDVVIGTGDGCPCRPEVGPNSFITTCDAAGTVTLAPTLPSGGVAINGQWEWTAPDASHPTPQSDGSITVPIQYGKWVLKRFDYLPDGVTLCFGYIETHYVIDQPIDEITIDHEGICNEEINLMDFVPNEPIYTNNTVIWYDASNNPISNTLTTTNNQTVIGEWKNQQGCVVARITLNIVVDCCLTDETYNSYIKTFEYRDNFGGQASIKTADGGIVILASNFLIGGRLSLIKFNASGALVWKRVHVKSGSSFMVKDLVEINGEFYAIGTAISPVRQGFVWKFSPTGEHIWLRTYNTTDEHTTFEAGIKSYVNFATVDAITVCGSTYDGNSFIHNSVIMRIQLNGNLDWMEIINHTFPNNTATNIVQIMDAVFPINYVMTTEQGILRTDNRGKFPLIKIRSGGAVQIADRIIQTKISTTNQQKAVLVAGTVLNPGDLNRAYLRKFDLNLNELWSKTYQGPQNMGQIIRTEGYDVIENRDANNQFKSYCLNGVCHDSEPFLLEVDANGDLVTSGINFYYPISMSSYPLDYEKSGSLVHHSTEGGFELLATNRGFNLSNDRIAIIKTNPQGVVSCEVPDLVQIDNPNFTHTWVQNIPQNTSTTVSHSSHTTTTNQINPRIVCCNNNAQFEGNTDAGCTSLETEVTRELCLANGNCMQINLADGNWPCYMAANIQVTYPDGLQLGLSSPTLQVCYSGVGPLSFAYLIEGIDADGCPCKVVLHINVVEECSEQEGGEGGGGEGLVINTLGISEELEKNSKTTHIYPNPSSGVYHIFKTSNNAKEKVYGLKIYNAIGALVYTQKEVMINKIEEIDLRFLPAGFYQLQVVLGDQKESFKLIRK